MKALCRHTQLLSAARCSKDDGYAWMEIDRDVDAKKGIVCRRQLDYLLGRKTINNRKD